jgi:O-antigen/teichoic acid export membrane protein
MSESLTKVAGKAMLWQSLQMGGVKAVYMVRLLVLARLLTPDDFGLVAIAVTAMGFLLNLTNFGMAPALIQAKQADDSSYDVAWTFNFTRSFVISLITIAAAPLIAGIFAEPRAVPIIQVLALRPILDGFASMKVAALNRNLHFRPLAILKIVEAVVNAVLSITLAIYFGVWGLVIGVLGGSAATVIASYILAPYCPRISFDRELMKPLLNFGRWILYTSVISMAGSYVLRIVISRQLGAAELGIYFLAAQLAFLPSEVASEVVGGVAFPLFARLQNNLQQAAKAFQAMLTGLAALLLPVCAMIIILSPVLVREILGAQWAGTEPVIQILTVVTMIGLLGDTTIPLVKGFGQPNRVTQIEFLQSGTIIALVWLLTTRFGVIGAALAWIPAIILVQLLCIYFVRKIFRSSLTEIKKPLLGILAATVLGAFPAIAIITSFPNILGLVVAGAVSALITALLLWTFDRRFSLGLVNNLAIVFPQIAPLLRISPPIEVKNS